MCGTPCEALATVMTVRLYATLVQSYIVYEKVCRDKVRLAYGLTVHDIARRYDLRAKDVFPPSL